MKFNHVHAYARIDTQLGTVLLAASLRGLCGLWFEGQKHQPDESAWQLDDRHALLKDAAAQLRAYLAAKTSVFDIPLDLSHGTEFQQLVWATLLAIPRGTTLRYGDVSQRIGRPTATRAVGAAIGRNPVSVIVPCHRVLGASGSLTGYAGGIERKRALLDLEGAQVLEPL